MKLEQPAYTVGELLDLATKGKLALPEFQRPYEWPPAEIAELLRTVTRKWPAGTFLLFQLSGKPPFEPRPLTGAPNLRRPQLMVLDGQQRITALYQAFTDKAQETYYVDIGKVIAARQFDDDHLKYEKRARFVTKYPGPKEQAAAGFVPVATVFDDEKFAEWVSFIAPKSRQQKFWHARRELVPGLSEYRFPCVQLPKGVDLAALAKIFEDTNRRGIPLKAFHLMVARLFPHGFKLRDEWDAARSRHAAILGSEGFDVDGMEVLKLIALQEHLRQKRRKVRPLKIKGVRESNVLDLEPALVKREWKRAIRNYIKALKFARDRCGAVRAAVLPHHTMLLPLAHGLSSAGRGGWHDDLERWFWTACFDQSYSQGANTQAVSDAEALEAWRTDRRATPDGIRNFTGDLLDELLLETRRRNEMLLKGTLCLLTKRDAVDWIESSVRIREATKPLQIHHIFAANYAKTSDNDEAELVCNFALILAATNQSVRNESPTHVAKRNDVSRVAVESHRVNWAALLSADWERFKTSRRKQLKALIMDAVAS